MTQLGAINNNHNYNKVNDKKKVFHTNTFVFSPSFSFLLIHIKDKRYGVCVYKINRKIRNTINAETFLKLVVNNGEKPKDSDLKRNTHTYTFIQIRTHTHTEAHTRTHIIHT